MRLPLILSALVLTSVAYAGAAKVWTSYEMGAAGGNLFVEVFNYPPAVVIMRHSSDGNTKAVLLKLTSDDARVLADLLLKQAHAADEQEAKP